MAVDEQSNAVEASRNVQHALEKLPEEERHIVETEFVRLQMSSHKGPLPSARSLRDYDLVLPGLAERIVTMAEREQHQRHRTEVDFLRREFKLNYMGLSAAFLALVMMLAVVAFMVNRGQATAGAALGGAVIVGVVVAFNTRQKRPDDASQPQESPHQE